MSEEMKALREASKMVFARRGPVKRGSWRGVRAIKYPTDLITYAEMIFEHQPQFIIETGTRYGGAALFLADVCKLNGGGHGGHVISIEIDQRFQPITNHENLTCLKGDSVSEEILDTVGRLVNGSSVMVILDSDHSPKHVRAEIEAYSQFLTVGDYLIVEDLHIEGADHELNRWLAKNKNKFKRDKAAEKYGIHAAREGFVRRIA